MPPKGYKGKGGSPSPQQRAYAQRNERPVKPENMLTSESSESDKAIYAAEQPRSCPGTGGTEPGMSQLLLKRRDFRPIPNQGSGI